MARQPSLASRLIGCWACQAEAREASEGWWSQAGSNRRPRHCERRALPAELWPHRDRVEVRRRPAIGAIYNPRQGQVKNGEIAVFERFCQELPLFARGGTDIYRVVESATEPPASKPAMRAVLDIVLIVLDLYVWLLIASAILSWLIAFNVVNTRNQFVASVAEFLYRITEPLLAPIRSFMPNLGGLDVSPIILILIIMFIQRVITYYIYPSVF
jgi:YggT family protein